MADKCRDVMTAEPVCCTPNDRADDIAVLMKDQDIGCVPVCDTEDGKRLVGMVTDRDLVVRVIAEGRDPERTRIGDIMTAQPAACFEDDDIERALEVMEVHQVRRIPVADRAGRIIGIISQADIATRVRRPEKTAEVVEQISKPKAGAGGA